MVRLGFNSSCHAAQSVNSMQHVTKRYASLQNFLPHLCFNANILANKLKKKKKSAGNATLSTDKIKLIYLI